MTENFRSSQASELFGGSWAKLPFSGGQYAEMTALLETALETNPNMHCAIRSMDTYNFEEDTQRLEENAQFYGSDLKNGSFFDYVAYLFDRDILYEKTLPMLLSALGGGQRGLMPFDQYSAWNFFYETGAKTVLENQQPFTQAEQCAMTDREAAAIRENIQKNIIDLAEKYPDTQFFCFFPPYSAAWWGKQQSDGLLTRQLEEEQLVIELLLPYENIHLFSWNTTRELCCDLNNYKDTIHYACWVNDWMLEQMAQGKGRLTYENYRRYLQDERELYENFAYNSLFGQADPEGSPLPGFFQ